MALLPVHDALQTVKERTPPPEAESVSWGGAPGRVLLRPVLAALDDPPFDRSSMDGYALRSADASAGARLTVLERVVAGGVPTRSVGPGEATKVMTGAPIPEGADCVLPVEHCREEGGELVPDKAPLPGDHIRRRGENFRAGGTLFNAGRRLDLLDLAVGDALCATEAVVSRRPTAAVLVTGSELVPPGQRPGPGQIVNTNGPMLAALWRGWGGDVVSESQAPDEERALESAIREGLGAGVLVLSGGVSAGDLDLVPQILGKLGVEVLFHKVRMKPGKPILFGLSGDHVVMGLPGNPVSAYVGAQLFLREVFRKRAGLPQSQWLSLPLAEGDPGGGGRTRFEPGVPAEPGGGVRLLPHMGSADLPAWREARFLVELPHDTGAFPKGKAVRCLPLRRRGDEEC
jgi:molybdopterin molybdotransferase